MHCLHISIYLYLWLNVALVAFSFSMLGCWNSWGLSPPQRSVDKKTGKQDVHILLFCHKVADENVEFFSWIVGSRYTLCAVSPLAGQWGTFTTVSNAYSDIFCLSCDRFVLIKCFILKPAKEKVALALIVLGLCPNAGACVGFRAVFGGAAKQSKSPASELSSPCL